MTQGRVRNNVRPADLKLVKDHETSKGLATGAIETYRAKPDERVNAARGRHKRFLDVDEVLARSLPKAIGQEF
jgi:hypothetical protein